jgi:hypothetical protein
LFVDVIFNSMRAIAPVTDEWLEKGETTRLSGMEVLVLSPTELLWSKVFVQDRCRYDGTDVLMSSIRRSRASPMADRCLSLVHQTPHSRG